MPRPKLPQRDILEVRETEGESPFWINGEPIAELIDRVLDWNRPILSQFLPMGLLDDSKYFTRDVQRGREGFEVPLFKCTCDDWGCGSFRVTIFIEADTVTWGPFTANGVAGTAPGLGPFVFDRRRYEDAFWIERLREGLQQTAWHLGTMDEEWVEQTLLTEVEKLVEAIATGETPLPDGRRAQRQKPLRQDLEEFRLYPRDVFDFDTGEVGLLAFEWWDEAGPDDWTVTVRIVYGGELPRLEVVDVQPVGVNA